MLLPIMTFNIQHGVDFNRRDKQSLKDFDAMTPEYLEKLKKQPPKAEDPSLIDLDQVAQAIRQCGAEIVALNEVRNTAPGVSDPCFTDQAREIAEKARLPYYYFGRAIDVAGKVLYGNALLSRYPFESIETLTIPDPAVKDEPTWYESRSLIRARIALPGLSQYLTVLVTHMGLAQGEAKNAVQTVLDAREEGAPTLLMGDFNLTPDSPLLTPLRAHFQDAAALLAPGEDLSYPSDVPERKIDYIMTAGPIEIDHAAIPAIVVSDRRPHTAVLRL